MHAVACSSTDRPKIRRLFLIRFVIFVFSFSIPFASIRLFPLPPSSTQINGLRIFNGILWKKNIIPIQSTIQNTLVELLWNKKKSYETGRTCISTFFGLQPVPFRNKAKYKYIEIKIEIMIAMEGRINRYTNEMTYARITKKKIYRSQQQQQ